MSDQIDVRRYLDLDKFINAVEENSRVQAGRFAEAAAKRFVQAGSDENGPGGALRDSISFDGKDSIGSDLPYAETQEYGRPGTNMQYDANRVRGFGYTPYLRPAAQAAAKAIEEPQLIRRYISAAILVSRLPGV